MKIAPQNKIWRELAPKTKKNRQNITKNMKKQAKNKKNGRNMPNFREILTKMALKTGIWHW